MSVYFKCLKNSTIVNVRYILARYCKPQSNGLESIFNNGQN